MVHGPEGNGDIGLIRVHWATSMFRTLILCCDTFVSIYSNGLRELRCCKYIHFNTFLHSPWTSVLNVAGPVEEIQAK